MRTSLAPAPRPGFRNTRITDVAVRLAWACRIADLGGISNWAHARATFHNESLLGTAVMADLMAPAAIKIWILQNGMTNAANGRKLSSLFSSAPPISLWLLERASS